MLLLRNEVRSHRPSAFGLMDFLEDHEPCCWKSFTITVEFRIITALLVLEGFQGGHAIVIEAQPDMLSRRLTSRVMSWVVEQCRADSLFANLLDAIFHLGSNLLAFLTKIQAIIITFVHPSLIPQFVKIDLVVAIISRDSYGVAQAKTFELGGSCQAGSAANSTRLQPEVRAYPVLSTVAGLPPFRLRPQAIAQKGPTVTARPYHVDLKREAVLAIDHQPRCCLLLDHLKTLPSWRL